MLKRIEESAPMKVGFLIAGVQKGGTSSLFSYLRQHRQIGAADTKEVHFFDDEETFREGRPDYAVYHRRFVSKRSARIYGEATPIYLYWSQALARIREYNPDMKIVVLLRNPVQRAWSHWQMETRRKMETLPFSMAIRQESARTREALPWQHRVYSYLDRGFYAGQINRVRNLFSERQLMFIKSERFYTAPAQTVAEVVKFLDLPPAPIDTSYRRNRDAGDWAMAEEDRQFLIDIFRSDVHQVESLLGWDCGDWLI
jgi:hypothetical protein